jgi:hypothetical protein
LPRASKFQYPFQTHGTEADVPVGLGPVLTGHPAQSGAHGVG